MTEQPPHSSVPSTPTEPLPVAINGFGRIGRRLARLVIEAPEFELVAVNDPGMDSTTAAHLLSHDTVHGTFATSFAADGSMLMNTPARNAAHRPIHCLHHSDPAAAANALMNHGCALLFECSGRFRTIEALAPFATNTAAPTVVSAPVPEIPNIVMGVNDQSEPLWTQSQIVSAASCTTNCAAPVVKLIHEAFEIERGLLTTIHAVTNTQRVLDAAHKDLRRARAAYDSLIPTTTGSATAITRVIPELAGRLDGVAVRAPINNASLTDLVLHVAERTSAGTVNDVIATAASGALAGIVDLELAPLVSADFTGRTASAIVDRDSTKVIDGQLIQLLLWYDNETGYCARMLDMAKRMLLRPITSAKV